MSPPIHKGKLFIVSFWHERGRATPYAAQGSNWQRALKSASDALARDMRGQQVVRFTAPLCMSMRPATSDEQGALGEHRGRVPDALIMQGLVSA